MTDLTQPKSSLPQKGVPGAALLGARRSLLASAAVAALLAGGVTFGTHQASAASRLFSPAETAAARVPAHPATVPGFGDLVAAVKPAVVSVRVKANSPVEAQMPLAGINPFNGTPFEKFFRGAPEFGDQALPQQRNPAPPQFVQGQGSGFFVSADGYVITNNHVVDHAIKVEIVTDDGTTYQAKVVGTDPKTDLALLKVDGRKDFPFVRLARQTPRIGEWVVAMGNPFGLGGTVTAGIVSARGRDIGSGPYDDFIQIDAPVNRGNSGGPTFNLKGEVIGVNTAIYSPSGGSVGIAFDIPAGTVAAIVPQLQEHGHVIRGWLGVQIQRLTKPIADSLGLAAAKGVLVAEPQAGGPAAKAGLKSGDVITMLDGKGLSGPRDLAKRVAALGPGKPVTLGIVRQGHPQDIKLELGRLKETSGRTTIGDNRNQNAVAHLGLTVAPASAVEGAGGKGLVVMSVEPGGRAAELGFQRGDVLLKAGGKALMNPEDLTEALTAARTAGHNSALILLERRKDKLFVAVPAVVG
ncbi:MAG: Do family serine endopeptidase [Hyphomicrobiaceae bacterium]|nr:Do family serine endopeptidase [Hyphomicrobiaceae bacterium]